MYNKVGKCPSSSSEKLDAKMRYTKFNKIFIYSYFALLWEKSKVAKKNTRKRNII